MKAKARNNFCEGKNIAIIGSGIGGLSAGIILTQLNYAVTIVEKNPRPGGLLRSYRRGGLNCPVGVHYVGALGADEPLGRMFKILGVNVTDFFEKMGQDGVIDRYVFDDFVFDLPAGIDAFAAGLRKSFPRETAAVDFIMTNLREIARRMMDPAFLINQGDPFQNIDFFTPMGEVLDKLSVSPHFRAVMGVPTQLIGVPLSQCPVIFHHMLLASYLFSSWRIRDDGDKLADLLARRFRELGGKIILSDAASRILSQEEKISGLQLQSGVILPADAVVSAIHPKALLGLVAENALRDSFRQRVLSLQETEGVIAVHVAVAALSRDAVKHNIYRLHTDERGTILDGIFYQLKPGANGDNLLSIITRSLYREWRAWENTKTGRRGNDYVQKKMKIAAELLARAQQDLGNIKNARIIDVFTPLTIRDYVNCPEGSCYGLMHSADQLLKIASLNNFPLPGIYLTGQNVVAPGIMGSIMGSFSAARQIAGAEKLNKLIGTV
ncbi:MAG TPA: FAD-dependent oxidoreductase [Smithellaceae bacterium]|nr:FAD-dependent oxidoreductase [Smithellaceae bacterium]